MLRRVSVIALGIACSFAGMSRAPAQQQDGLRGEVQEQSINAELLDPGRRSTTPSANGAASQFGASLYQPISDGAVADTDPAFDDPLATQPEPGSPAGRTNTTAAQAGLRNAASLPASDDEDDLTTGTVRAQRLDTLDEAGNGRATSDNPRIGAIESITATPEDNPYAPLGLRVGTFNLVSTLEQGIGWTSNATSAPGGDEAVFSETSVRLDAVSDWSRHSAAIRADGTWRESLSGEKISEFEGGVTGELRLDLGNDIDATASLGYRARPESASSPVDIGDVVSQPLRQTFTGGMSVSRDVGRLGLGVSADVTRDIYDDAKLANGNLLSQEERNSTLATVALRAGYEISPALRPFVEAEIGRRYYDLKVDDNGYARSADRYGLRGGVELDLGEKLSGEISAGWLTETPDDDQLDDIAGLWLGGNATWSPVRGTTVEFNGSTTVEGTTAAGESGSLLYSGSLALRRDLRSNLTGRALVGLDFRDYVGSDDDETILRGEASLTWWMNRYAGITGRARHEIQRSDRAGRDYDATSLYLGMTLQR